MKILYYVPGFGSPNISEKLDILIHNLNYLRKQINNKITLIINCYDNFENIENFIKKIEFIDYFVHNQKGVLAELWLQNPYNNMIKNYDYILFIMDDVKLINYNLNDMISIKKKFDIRILSPKVMGASHSFMYKNTGLVITNANELMCYLLTPDDFEIYKSINNIDNKWMWGSDFMYGYFNISSAIYNKYCAKHFFHTKYNEEIDNSRYHQMNLYLNKYNFETFEQLKKKYPTIIKIINI